MKTRKLHSLELIGDLGIINLRLEQLDADPTSVQPGRLWYNKSIGAIRFSHGKEGAVIVSTLGDGMDGIDVVARRAGLDRVGYLGFIDTVNTLGQIVTLSNNTRSEQWGIVTSKFEAAHGNDVTNALSNGNVLDMTVRADDVVVARATRLLTASEVSDILIELETRTLAGERLYHHVIEEVEVDGEVYQKLAIVELFNETAITALLSTIELIENKSLVALNARRWSYSGTDEVEIHIPMSTTLMPDIGYGSELTLADSLSYITVFCWVEISPGEWSVETPRVTISDAPGAEQLSVKFTEPVNVRILMENHMPVSP